MLIRKVEFNKQAKLQLKDILIVLHKFHKAMNGVGFIGTRKNYIESNDMDRFEVLVSKGEDYNYIVEITDTVEKDSHRYIHVDGISEERKTAPKNSGIFDIVCMEDIYNSCFFDTKIIETETTEKMINGWG